MARKGPCVSQLTCLRFLSQGSKHSRLSRSLVQYSNGKLVDAYHTIRAWKGIFISVMITRGNQTSVLQSHPFSAIYNPRGISGALDPGCRCIHALSGISKARSTRTSVLLVSGCCLNTVCRRHHKTHGNSYIYIGLKSTVIGTHAIPVQVTSTK